MANVSLDVHIPPPQEHGKNFWGSKRIPTKVRHVQKQLKPGVFLHASYKLSPGSGLFGPNDYRFQIRRASSSTSPTLNYHTRFDEYISDAKLSPDGRYLAIAWSNGWGFLYDAQTLKEVLDISAPPYRMKNYIPFMQVLTPRMGRRDQIHTKVLFSPTGRYVYYRELGHVTIFRLRWF